MKSKLTPTERSLIRYLSKYLIKSLPRPLLPVIQFAVAYILEATQAQLELIGRSFQSIAQSPTAFNPVNWTEISDKMKISVSDLEQFQTTISQWSEKDREKLTDQDLLQFLAKKLTDTTKEPR